MWINELAYELRNRTANVFILQNPDEVFMNSYGLLPYYRKPPPKVGVFYFYSNE
jgi:hypothetical protein